MSRHSRGILLTATLGGVLFVIAWLVFRGDRSTPDLPAFDRQGAPPALLQTLDELEAELASAPNAENWGRLGMFYLAHFANAPALKCFEHAEQAGADDFRWPYLAGVVLEITDLEQAEQAYARAAERRTDYPPLQFRWATVLLRLDRLQEAEEHFRVAAQLAEGDPHPLIGLARVASANGHDVEAAQMLRQVVGQAAWSQQAHAELASALQRLGDLEAAQRHQQQAARLPASRQGIEDPLLSEIHRQEMVSRNLAITADQLAAKGDLDGAIRSFRQLAEQRPDMPRAGIGLAQVLFQKGDLPAAARTLRQLLEAFPQEADAHYLLGMVCEAGGDRQAAAASYRRCLEIKPSDANANFALGMNYEQSGELSSALRAYRGAVESAPHFAPAQLALGAALIKSGRLDEAFPYLRAAVQLAPGDPVPQQFLDRAVAERRKLQEAEKRGAGPAAANAGSAVETESSPNRSRLAPGNSESGS